MNDYYNELNFNIEFNLSRNGMIKEIEAEFDILQMCFIQLQDIAPKHFPSIDRIMVMPLRKLLCEKNSVLLKVCPDFKMLPLCGNLAELDNKFKIMLSPYAFTTQDKWIDLEDWLSTRIAYFDKTASDVPSKIPDYVFQTILNKLNKTEKQQIQSFYNMQNLMIEGESYQVSCLKSNCSDAEKQTVFDLLKKSNYYDLSIYNFIKHLSDKRGAHIDIGHGPVIELVNQRDKNEHTPVLYFSIQLIWAAKKQIPELSNYWYEMDSILASIIK